MKKNIYQLSSYQNKKCIYGLGTFEGKSIFYKTMFNDLKEELNGYNIVSKYYKVPKIISYDNDLIIYEYNKSLINKSIFDYLYINDELILDITSIFNQYKSSLKDIKYLNEEEVSNKKFYKDRINMLDDLINDNEYKKYHSSFKKIKEKLLEDKKLYSFVSQGDPTDTNITVDGLFCDFENGGYNSLVGEIAIFIASILTHGPRIYPKYNKKAYMIKNVDLNNIKFSKKNINLVLEYLNFYKENLNREQIEELDKYLKYYLCFRMISPIKLEVMDDIDKEYVLDLINKFMKINSFDELIVLVNNWELS